MKTLNRIISALRKLPGVGPRQAERFALYFLRASRSETEGFIYALRELKNSVKMCRRCMSYSEGEICPICSDPSRDPETLCIVEETQDVEAIEKTKAFNGIYYVLHGIILPNENSQIKTNELLRRLHNAVPPVKEIIIATDPNTEGETTALYLAEILREKVSNISRIAYGVPLGGDLDYTDELTLRYALKGRTKI